MSLKNLFKHWTYQVFAPGTLLREKYTAFKELLRYDDICLELIAEIEDIHYGHERADWSRVAWLCGRLERNVDKLVNRLRDLSPTRYVGLEEYAKKIHFYIKMGLDMADPALSPPYLLRLEEVAGKPHLAGGKAANLGRVSTQTGLPVLPGFVVTANAFNYFLEANELRPRLGKCLKKLILSRPDDLAELADEMRGMILAATLPVEISAPVAEAAARLAERGQGGLAVRSSAVSEDGAVSFAGQYDSFLNVAPEEAVQAYKMVLAGKYSPRALTYRIQNGLADEETPMAVLIMPMVPAAAAGVVYSRDPGEDAVGVYAVPGYGGSLVDGSLRAEIRLFSREEPPAAPTPIGPHPLGSEAVLDINTARRLAEAGLALEQLFGEPQDVEWARGSEGEPYIVQSRPMYGSPSQAEEEAEPELPEASLLFENSLSASRGVASGPVSRLSAVMDVSAVPEGSVLVVATLSPALARVADRLAAVISRSGSRASHFASVARELGLPVLICDECDHLRLPDGQEVTVDANSGRVYLGRVESLLPRGSRPTRRETPASRRLAAIMPHIARLNLTDPDSENFAPEGVKSLHDIVRFCHEKSVSEMFSLVRKGGRGLGQAKKLKTRLPLTMYVLDLEDGLFPGAREQDEIRDDDIRSVPMWSFWFGMSSPEVTWSEKLPHMDWEEFDRLSGGIISVDSKLLSSYAVISAQYMHLMIRFGYHFSVVDAFLGSEDKNNYLNFRFKGGGGSFEQRLARLAFISGVLTNFDFEVRRKGDMLDASLSRHGEAIMQKRLAMLGYLLARTRLMDMALGADSDIDRLVADFMAEIKDKSELTGDLPGELPDQQSNEQPGELPESVK